MLFHTAGTCSANGTRFCSAQDAQINPSEISALLALVIRYNLSTAGPHGGSTEWNNEQVRTDT